jgi:hypothetical protein
MDNNYPAKLLQRMRDFEYGLFSLKYNKPILINDPKFDEVTSSNEFRVLQPNELDEYKVGTCWEKTLYAYYNLTKQNYKCNFIYIKTINESLHHTTVIFKDIDGLYWFESAWDKHFGVNKINNVLDILSKYNENIRKLIMYNPNVNAIKLLNNYNLDPYTFVRVCEESLIIR